MKPWQGRSLGLQGLLSHGGKEFRGVTVPHPSEDTFVQNTCYKYLNPFKQISAYPQICVLKSNSIYLHVVNISIHLTKLHSFIQIWQTLLIYLGVSPSWKISGWWWAALKAFREKKKLAVRTIQHHMTKVSTNVAPLNVYITRSGMNGIASSFFNEGLSLPLMVNNHLKNNFIWLWVLK